MIKYQDYFPKSMLHKCGIDPDTNLISEDQLSVLNLSKNEEKTNQLIGDIYLNIKNLYDKNNYSDIEFKQMNVERKIVSMLCDLDVISEIDKEKYFTSLGQKHINGDYEDVDETRVSIELSELNVLNINNSTEKSERVISNNQPILENKGKLK